MSSYKQESTFSKFTNALLDYDIYAHPVSLQYDGKSSYPTGFGLGFTIFTALFIIVYCGISMIEVFVKDYKLDSNLVTMNPYKNTTGFDITSDLLDVAYQYIYVGELEDFKQNPQRYVEVELIQVVNTRASTTTEPYKKHSCEFHSFPYLDNSISEEIGLKSQDFRCFSNLDIWNLTGTYGQSFMVYYAFELNTCNDERLQEDYPGETCAPPEVINKVVDELQIMVIFFEQSFIPEDFSDHPFQVIPQIYYFNFDTDTSTVQEVLVKKSKYTLEDSWISSSVARDVKEIYAIEPSQLIQGTISYPEYPMFGIWFRKGFIESRSTRTVANLSELFSALGGLLGVLTPVCVYLVGPYAQTAFNNAILKKLYKEQEKSSDNHNDDDDDNDSPSNKGSLNPDPYMDQLIKKLLKQIKHRKPPSLSYSFAYFSFLSRCRKDFQDMEFRENQILSRLEFETSIDRMLKKLRQAELATEIYFDEKQRKLIPYMYKNLIISDPETQLTSQTSNYKDIYKIQRKMFAKVSSKKDDSGEPQYQTQDSNLSQGRQKYLELKESLLWVVRGMSSSRESQVIFMGLQNLEEGSQFQTHSIQALTCTSILKGIKLRKNQNQEADPKAVADNVLDQWEKEEKRGGRAKVPLLP